MSSAIAQAPPAIDERAAFEESVIGGILVHSRVLDDVTGLRSEDFTSPVLASIFGAMLSLRRESNPIDALTVANRMRASGTLERLRHVGGVDYFTELMAKVVTVENIGHHALKVSSAASRRRLGLALAKIAEATNTDNDAIELVERTQRALDEERAHLAPPASRVVAVAADAARAAWARPLPPPMPTGLTPLDAAIGGIRAESVYALAGSTGKGKTGAAIQLARGTLLHAPVVYLSSELSERQVLARFAAQILGVGWGELYGAPPDRAASIERVLREHAARLRVTRLGRETSISDVLDRVADVEGVAPVLVLDYLQHAARRMGGDDPRVVTAALSDEVTTWVTTRRGSAIVVSSVPRGFYQGHAERTATDYLGAAKNSGDVEFDASGVLFLDADPCPLGGTAAARLHVAKSRFGGEGTTIGLRFDGAVGMFTPDASAAFTEDQRAVLEAIRSGATSVEEVRASIGKGKKPTQDLIDLLVRRGVVARRPLRVNEQRGPS